MIRSFSLDNPIDNQNHNLIRFSTRLAQSGGFSFFAPDKHIDLYYMSICLLGVNLKQQHS